MVWPELHNDFKEFLRLLNRNDVEYLVIGGYAVGFQGYARSTNDFDVWVNSTSENRSRVATTLREFGFDLPELAHWEREPGMILRMGIPPTQLEVFVAVTGLEFPNAYRDRDVTTLEDIQVNVLSLKDLRAAKKAAGRAKDLADLENLPEPK